MTGNVLRIILLGAPGAGKGTQAKFISRRFSVPQISTGDILRKEIDSASDIGREAKRYMVEGLLVPDALVVEIVRRRLGEPDCETGYILDGFPRTLQQAEAIDRQGVVIDMMILLDAPDDIILRRLTGRRICPECQRMYHLEYNRPAVDEICDDCRISLIKRKDDEPETIRKRIDVFRRQTAPLVDYYRNHSDTRFYHVNGGESDDDTPDVVFQRIVGVIEEDPCK